MINRAAERALSLPRGCSTAASACLATQTNCLRRTTHACARGVPALLAPQTSALVRSLAPSHDSAGAHSRRWCCCMGLAWSPSSVALSLLNVDFDLLAVFCIFDVHDLSLHAGADGVHDFARVHAGQVGHKARAHT